MTDIRFMPSARSAWAGCHSLRFDRMPASGEQDHSPPLYSFLYSACALTSVNRQHLHDALLVV